MMKKIYNFLTLDDIFSHFAVLQQCGEVSGVEIIQQTVRGGVAVSGTSEVFDTVQSHDQIFNLLYTTAYRLTGNHQLTAELIDVSMKALNRQGRERNIGARNMLKTLCTVFITKTAALVCGRKQKAIPLKYYQLSRSRAQMQEALLQLPPMERLLVVLRDILGLTYAEMAELTGLKKTDVAGLLSAGRWSLRFQVTNPNQLASSK